MTPEAFTALARTLVESGIAFRARPGRRTLKTCPKCIVVGVDLTSEDCAQDMQDGLVAARKRRYEPV